MSVGPEMSLDAPWQWCWQCGRALWDWSTVYETTTFFGRVALCRQCGKDSREAKRAETRNGLLGYHDRATWKRSKKGDKQ